MATNCVEIYASLLGFQLSFSDVNSQENHVGVLSFPRERDM